MADGGRHLHRMGERAPDTKENEPETSIEALLDELVRALAREAAARDYAALRDKPRHPGGKKDSR
jgi:hypothetical protein